MRITCVFSPLCSLNDLSCKNAHGPQRLFTCWKSRLRRRDHTTRMSVGDKPAKEDGSSWTPCGSRAHESRKKLSVSIRRGLHARMYLCILRFVGTIGCERKV